MLQDETFRPLFSQTRAKDILKLDFIPTQQSMVEMAEWFIQNNMFEKKDVPADASNDGAPARHTDVNVMFAEMVELALSTEDQVRFQTTFGARIRSDFRTFGLIFGRSGA